ncbi:MAG: hypothetical protein E7773_14310 [Sphingomonas sp.]|uniref:hypothetical protein n=1 Tax=Sphingomonas sp. TaxID=28214 RepID=UPI0012248645|nr:hypothetical protein [Sphingomonas sp.]THD34827.1 MAG: hypothetical protein E7773_14310 [Sphingomonas sp.]
MKRLLILAVALAAAGCHKNEAPVAANEGAANITSVDANAMPDDANITDVPADDGDAPAEEPASAKHPAKTPTKK